MKEEPIITEDEILYGKNAVIEFLKSGGRADTLYLSTEADEQTYKHIIAHAKEVGAVVKKVHPIKLEHLCNSSRHQGVALACTLCEYCEIEDLFACAQRMGAPPFLVIADGIEDPHNLGAIIRTAECAGAHGIVIPKRHGCAVTAAVHRASAGACSHLPIARVSNLASAVRDIKARGVFVYCAEADGQLCYDVDLTGAIAIVVGSEGFGVSRLIRDLCDGTIKIPMYGAINSLNASVAAGVLLYEVVRQTHRKGADLT